jgi:hypothetical protein
MSACGKSKIKPTVAYRSEKIADLSKIASLTSLFISLSTESVDNSVNKLEATDQNRHLQGGRGIISL